MGGWRSEWDEDEAAATSMPVVKRPYDDRDSRGQTVQTPIDVDNGKGKKREEHAVGRGIYRKIKNGPELRKLVGGVGPGGKLLSLPEEGGRDARTLRCSASDGHGPSVPRAQSVTVNAHTRYSKLWPIMTSSFRRQ